MEGVELRLNSLDRKTRTADFAPEIVVLNEPRRAVHGRTVPNAPADRTRQAERQDDAQGC
jgi:hypothetical protein